MQPLSPRTRRLYLAAFVSMFFAILPLVIMYADGWRWKKELGFYKTGGVYVSVPYPDADVSIDGEPVGHSGFLERSFYIGDLAPSAYVIRASREGYRSWGRVVVVEPQLVTDTEVVLIPTEILATRLVVSGAATSGVTLIPRDQYAVYSAAFASVIASTTVPQDESNGVGLYVLGGDVYVRWMPEEAFPPSRFCGRPSFCVRDIVLGRNEGTVLTARFFRGGVVFATKEGDVYFAEADARPTPLIAQIFHAENVDVRVVDDTLIVKSGTDLYRISL